MLINQAEKVYLGNQEAQKVYLGSRLVWELQSEPAVSEETFTLFGRHGSKSRNSPYVSVGKQDFINFGVAPTTVNAITVNGERYDVTRIDDSSVSDVYIYIENADSLALNGFETLTIHYSLRDMPSEPDIPYIPDVPDAPDVPDVPDVSEATFTLVGRHFDKPQNLPYIMIRKKDFEKFGVNPTTVTAITVNGERYDVTRVEDEAFSVYLNIENANSLTLSGSETLLIHYRA